MNKIRRQKGTARISIRSDFFGLPSLVLTLEDKLEMYADVFNGAVTTNSRGRRQIGMIAAAGGAILGMGISMYNLAETQMLEDSVNNIRMEQDVIVSRVDQNSLRINQISYKMEKITSTMKTLIMEEESQTLYDQALALTLNTTSVAHVYASIVEDYLQGLQMLTMSKLSPLIVSQRQVHRTFEDVCSQAAALGLKPIIESPHLIFSSKASPIILNNRLHAVVKVPLVDHNQLTLLKFINGPIVFGNVQFNLNLQDNILAFNEEETLISSFDEKTLIECDKFGTHFHCLNFNVLQKDVDSSCVYSLYKLNPDGIRNNCNPTVSKIRNLVTQLSKGEFRVISTEPTPLDISCNNGTRKKEMLPKVSKVQIAPGCSGSVNNFYLLHAVGFHISADLIEYPLVVNQSDFLYDMFPQLLNSDLSPLSQLESIIANVTDTKEDHPISNLRHILTVQGLMKEQVKQVTWQEKLKHFMISVLVLFGCAVMIYACLKFKVCDRIVTFCSQRRVVNMNRHGRLDNPPGNDASNVNLTARQEEPIYHDG